MAGSNEDLASTIERILAKEKVLLKQVQSQPIDTAFMLVCFNVLEAAASICEHAAYLDVQPGFKEG